jgi:hypothetical protein
MKFSIPVTKKTILFFLQIFVCCFIVLESVFQISCRITAEGIQILSGDYVSPEIVSFTVRSENILEMVFSESVKVNEAVVFPVCNNEMEDISIAGCNDRILQACLEYNDNDRKVKYILTDKTVLGKKYELSGSVKDNTGNSLTFSIPFTGYNGNIPCIILSEVQDGKYENHNLKYEFIELYILKPGNLSGLIIYSANDGEESVYEFPGIDVRSGEYITVHLRNDGAGCIDETADDLTLSTGYASCNTARDLWWQNTKACLGNSGDVIILKNSNDGTLLDALVYCRSDKTEWPKTALSASAAEVFKAGIWVQGEKIEDAVCVEKKSSPYFFARKNIENLIQQTVAGTFPSGPIPVYASDWIMIKPSASSPGEPNFINASD